MNFMVMFAYDCGVLLLLLADRREPLPFIYVGSFGYRSQIAHGPIKLDSDEKRVARTTRRVTQVAVGLGDRLATIDIESMSKHGSLPERHRISASHWGFWAGRRRLNRHKHSRRREVRFAGREQ